MPAVFSPVSRAALVRQVRALIHRRKGVELRRLRVSTDLNELGFDLIDVVDIILEVERRYDLTIPDEVPLDTVGDFVRYIGCHRQLAAA
ncbi:acyl carrier protein [Hymenobacter sp. AT01-02]|uniref:acyl carrier protein n=1 Tax=Hymenobacter sp. AT01-02 TaxID=1571877 RepID=UPI0005F25A21|nr:phosphopantetheine-binding protein [Hymenobacter sp. AT01-02]